MSTSSCAGVESPRYGVFASCLPYFRMSRKDHILYRTSLLRSAYSKMVFIAMFAGYPVFILLGEHWFDRVGASVMLLACAMEIYAIFYGSDKMLIYMTRTVQILLVILTTTKQTFGKNVCRHSHCVHSVLHSLCHYNDCNDRRYCNIYFV